MSWHLYRKDDPNSWPEIDCPMLVYDECWCDFYICKWDNEIKRFVEPKGKILHCWKECYYQYIGYVPNGYVTIKTAKCNAELQVRCDFDDDGYCEDTERMCPFRKNVNEYVLNDNKRLWKEFE